MPRGVKGSGQQRGKSLDQKITENDAQIESLQIQLADAKAKRKELMREKDKLSLSEIQKIIHKSGITPEELKALISAKTS